MFKDALNFNQCLSSWATKTPKKVLTINMLDGTQCPNENDTPDSTTGTWCQGANEGCFTSAPTPTPSASVVPSTFPSSASSIDPSGVPSSFPSLEPSLQSSNAPSFIPNLDPSHSPSTFSSRSPSTAPSFVSSLDPSGSPSSVPSGIPILRPSLQTSHLSSSLLSSDPSLDPSKSPSLKQSVVPSIFYDYDKCGIKENSYSDYRSNLSKTEDNQECQPWGEEDRNDYPGSGLFRNYCRNPDGEDRVWCYTSCFPLLRNKIFCWSWQVSWTKI